MCTSEFCFNTHFTTKDTQIVLYLMRILLFHSSKDQSVTTYKIMIALKVDR